MIRTFSLLTALLFAAPVLSSGQVNYLDVNGDIVVFATEATKTNTSPACVGAANSDKWAVSLNSESGRAIYSLLMTALVTKMRVNVESAGDCADQDGYERAQRVWLDAVAGGTNSSASGAPKLAPDLNFVGRIESTAITTLNRFNSVGGEFVTALELTGKQVISELRLSNFPREWVHVRLTIDNEVIWDSGRTFSNGYLRLISNSNNGLTEQYAFESSFKLEVKTISGGSHVTVFHARPIA